MEISPLEEEYNADNKIVWRANHTHTIKRGLQTGLSKYFGEAIRVAFIYSIEPAPPSKFFIHDTLGLLDPYKADIDRHYLKNNPLVVTEAVTSVRGHDLAPNIHKNLICRGAQTRGCFYHTLFVEDNDAFTASCKNIIAKWAEFAQIYFLHDPGRLTPFYESSTERVMEHAAFDVVQSILGARVQAMAPFSTISATILGSLLEIAKMKEEGTGCSGSLVILDEHAQQTEIKWTFGSPVDMTEHKHVRKLLTSTSSNFCLAVVGTEVKGITEANSLPQQCVKAEFKKGACKIAVNNEDLCKLSNGAFRSISDHRLINWTTNSRLFSSLPQDSRNIICSFLDQIAKLARDSSFGCTLLLDFGEADDRVLSGKRLSNPLKINDTNLSLIEGMCKVDGAVHIDLKAMKIRSFACLLDGKRLDSENLARGARYNSACRYSNSTNDVAVLVISEDGPLTLFEDGKPTKNIKTFIDDPFPPASYRPLTLEQWLANKTG